MSDKNFKVKNGLTIQGTTDTLITADNAGGILIAGAPLSSLPSQTGNSGKYLSTNGTVSSWQSVESPVSVYYPGGIAGAQTATISATAGVYNYTSNGTGITAILGGTTITPSDGFSAGTATLATNATSISIVTAKALKTNGTLDPFPYNFPQYGVTVAYSSGLNKWIAIPPSSGLYWLSSDAITWTQYSAPSSMTSNPVTAIGGPQGFVVYSSNSAFNTTNGINWTTKSDLTAQNELYPSLTYANGRYAYVSGSSVYASTDNVTYTSSNNGGAWSSSLLQGITYANGMWIITDRSVMYPTSFWTNSNANPTTGTWTRTYANSLYGGAMGYEGSFFLGYANGAYTYIVSDGSVYRAATLSDLTSIGSVGLSGKFGLATQVGSTIAIAGGGDAGTSGAYKTSTDGGVTWNSYTGLRCFDFNKPVLTNNGSGLVLMGYFNSGSYASTSKLSTITPLTDTGSITLTKATVTS